MEIAGLYTGGPVKFGYRLVDSGLVNKKGQPIKKLEIDPAEEAVIHLIDDMTVESLRTAFICPNLYYNLYISSRGPINSTLHRCHARCGNAGR